MGCMLHKEFTEDGPSPTIPKNGMMTESGDL